MFNNYETERKQEVCLTIMRLKENGSMFNNYETEFASDQQILNTD